MSRLVQILCFVLLVLSCLSARCQISKAPLFAIGTGAVTGNKHPSSNVPTHFSSVGQPMPTLRPRSDKPGGGVMNATDLMFTLAINSFTPRASAVGSAVTITGAGFSETLTRNVVRFGATRASVTAATPQTLTVTVPAGATYQPISVTVDGQTAYSTLPHTVTFTSTTTLGNSFGTPVDININTPPFEIAVVDIDGDGKPDVAATGGDIADVLVVLRNIHVSGQVSASSFAARMEFEILANSSPLGITYGDIDSDGKLDIIVSCAAIPTISILRNASTPGTISFDPRIDIAVTGIPEGVFVTDLDIDGKPDIGVQSFGGNTSYVLKNRSEPGSVTFAPQIGFVSPAPWGGNISAADLNGDRKPEIIISPEHSDTGSEVQVFKNATIIGGIFSDSFVSTEIYSITGLSGTQVIWNVEAADLDVDGNLDLVTPSFTNGAVWIVRSNVSGGVIGPGSFVEPFSMPALSNTKEVATGDLDGDGKPELVAGASGGLTIFPNASSVGSLSAGSFQSKIDKIFTGGTRCIVIADLNADSRPELVFANSDHYVSVLNNVDDAIPPSILNLYPSDNSTGIGITAGLAIDFNESIQKGTGTVTILTSGGSLVESIDIANAVVSNNQLTIDPANFPAGADLYVTLSSGAIKDLAGNSFAGFSDNTTWNFSIAGSADVTAPTALTLSPLDDATNVATASDLVLTFDESVVRGTGAIVIHHGSDNSIVQSIDVTSLLVTVTGAIVTVDHTDFAPGTDLYVNIAPGVIKDLSNNPYAGIAGTTTWNFTTTAAIDNTPPALSNNSPADGATNVSVNSDLSMTFSEAVKKGVGNIVIKNISDASVVESIPVSSAAVAVTGQSVTVNTLEFPADLGLYVLIDPGAIEDLAGNDFAGISDPTVWNFTTSNVDPTPPVVTSYLPPDNSTGILVNANLVLTFNENAKKGTGNITIKKVSDNSIVEAIDVSTAIVSGATVTVNPANDLPFGTPLYVNIAVGAIEDLAGNDYAGISDAATWNFTTEDNTPPAIERNVQASVQKGNKITIKAAVTDSESPISDVFVRWKRTEATTTSDKPMHFTTGSDYEVDILASEFGDQGIEYKISATSAGGTNLEVTYGTVVVVINNDNKGLEIPYNAHGEAISNFRIISVPLDLTDKTLTGVFDELSPRDPKKWRVARYENNGISAATNQTYSGNIEHGKGYWLIVKSNSGPIFSGPGASVTIGTDAVYKIPLKTGWNQIGNPLMHNIVWSDVVTANPGITATIRVHRSGTFENEDKLLFMEGGFLNVTSDRDLIIPAAKNPSAERKTPILFKNAIDTDNWEVYLNAEHGEMKNLISGIGMRKNAADGYDPFDGFSMPRFSEYLEVKHNKELNGFAYSMDIVPTADDHVWAFNVESSLEEKEITFSWDNTYFGVNNKQLVLWDVALQRPVNMRETITYRFARADQMPFKVIFGSTEFVEKETYSDRLVLHSVSPNPAQSDVTVAFGLPRDGFVRIDLVDMIGKQVTVFREGYISKGHHQVTWQPGLERRITPGVYLVRVTSGNEMRIERLVYNP